jgi:hypothetical protein
VKKIDVVIIVGILVIFFGPGLLDLAKGKL